MSRTYTVAVATRKRDPDAHRRLQQEQQGQEEHALTDRSLRGQVDDRVQRDARQELEQPLVDLGEREAALAGTRS